MPDEVVIQREIDIHIARAQLEQAQKDYNRAKTQFEASRVVFEQTAKRLDHARRWLQELIRRER